MAYNQASAFFLIALIFFAAANPLAYGQIPLPPSPPSGLTNVTIRGILCCTPTGNCQPGSQPAAGAVVDVNCTRLTGQTVRIGQGITAANGSFSINVNLTSDLLPLNVCTTRIQLPLNRTVCPALSTVKGSLVGIMDPINSMLGRIIVIIVRIIVIVIC